MGKANKAVKVHPVVAAVAAAEQQAVVGVVNQVTAAPNAPTLFTVVPPKRPLTGVKYGVSGNAYTHAKLAEAASKNGGTLTAAEAMAVCKECAHQSFYSYAVNRLRILTPVVPGSVLAVGPL